MTVPTIVASIVSKLRSHLDDEPAYYRSLLTIDRHFLDALEDPDVQAVIGERMIRQAAEDAAKRFRAKMDSRS